MATFNDIDTFDKLRDAVNSSRSNSEADTINITGDIFLTSLLPPIEEDVALTINGGNFSVDGGNLSHLFSIKSGTINFDSLTFANGLAQSSNIDIGGGQFAMGNALFIYDDFDGIVSITNSTFTNNQVVGDSDNQDNGNNGGGDSTGAGGSISIVSEGIIVTNPAPLTDPSLLAGQLTPVAAAKVLEVTSLGAANLIRSVIKQGNLNLSDFPSLSGATNTLKLWLEQVGINSVSDLRIFSTDALGNNRTQIDSFSLLKGSQLPAAYTPEFTLNSSNIADGQFLQFELGQNGVSRIATATLGSNGRVELDFGNGTRLLAALADQTPTTNLLRDDAATIDLTGLAGPLSVEFTVYREAAFNNTVGLYRTDNASGGITDPLTGTLINPGEAGYKAVALARQLDLRLTGQNGKVNSFSADVAGGGYLGTFLIVNGADPAASEVFFSHMGANSDGSDHAKMLGNNTFGFEDLAGLGDRDFNDVVVKFAVV